MSYCADAVNTVRCDAISRRIDRVRTVRFLRFNAFYAQPRSQALVRYDEVTAESLYSPPVSLCTAAAASVRVLQCRVHSVTGYDVHLFSLRSPWSRTLTGHARLVGTLHSFTIDDGPSAVILDQAQVPALVSVTPHTLPHASFRCVRGQSLVSTSSPRPPHTSSRHSFSEGVCVNAQLLGNAAVVNNIYVPPPCAPSSAVCRKVSAMIKRPIVLPRVVRFACSQFLTMHNSAGLNPVSVITPCSFNGHCCQFVTHY